MSIAPFPHHYVVTLGHGELAAPPRASLRTGAPPQFGGSDQVWSPEELLVGAALSCLETTFAAYARRASVPIHDWHGTATGTLVKAAGGPVFTSIDLAIVVVTESGHEAQAEQLLHDADRACIVARALAVPVRLSATVTIAPALAAS